MRLKRLVRLSYLVFILFALLIASGCGSSGSGDDWNDQNLEDSIFAQSVAVGSVYVAGIDSSDHALVWSLDSGVWENAIYLDPLPAVANTILYNDGLLSIGAYNMYYGYVTQYDSETQSISSLSLQNTKIINDMDYWNGNLVVTGQDMSENAALWLYTGGEWETVPVTGALSTYEAVAASGGDLFVGGLNATDTAVSTAYCTIAFYDGSSWTNLQPAEKVPYIWSLEQDGNGGVYACGRDKDFNGQVWQVSRTGDWASLELEDAFAVYSIRLADSGVLYVGGQDTDGKGRVWTYKDGTWGSLGTVGDSMRINDLAIKDDGRIVAVGLEDYIQGQVWIYE